MSMFYRRFAAVCCWVALLASVVAAQPSDWTAVVTIPSGLLIKVESSAEGVRQGELLRAETGHLTTTVANRSVDIRREDVRRVYRVSQRNVRRLALLGFGIG